MRTAPITFSTKRRDHIKNLCQQTCQQNQLCIDRCMGFFENEITKQKLGLDQPNNSALLERPTKPALLPLPSSNCTTRHGSTRASDDQDICFLDAEGAEEDTFTGPFVTESPARPEKGRAATSGSQKGKEKEENAASPQWRGIFNRPLFALGLLRVELSLGKPLDEFRKTYNPPRPTSSDDATPAQQYDELSDCALAEQPLDRICDMSGSGYADAVRRCVRCSFDTRRVDLGDGPFWQAVYDGVAAPLEKVLRHFEGRWEA
ncbi:hypothetical protein B0J12DRAFT_741232 [Macrophomina phaseolina]|uniref:Uncharacterized protein n=1 Tax=Macrophomina phaseolina TaxID=35725 RepID=A0ABQ8G959_9PEZI|nr:hypothetical protein B0J12DRAFT_741232 [Macrophomina phaseolina]